MLIYESIRLIYYHFSLRDKCPYYSSLLVVVIVSNIVWFWLYFFGFMAMNKKTSSYLKMYAKCMSYCLDSF